MYLFKLPSGVDIELREMTGNEEELLTNQRLIRSGDAVNQVLKNCIVRLGDNNNPGINDILDLLSGDRLFILIKLRQISLGDELDLELVCPSTACRTVNPITIILENLPVTHYGNEREYTFKLPASGWSVRFVHLNGHMEKRLGALKEATITSGLLMRIIEIDGQPPSKKALNDMVLRDRNALRGEMLRVDAGINTLVDLDCENCGTRIRTRLEAEPDFLFPGARF